MTYVGLHVLERGYQTVRGIARVAARLREEMEERRITAKELAFEMRSWAGDDLANRWALDYRTIQNAAQGTACALDTYLALAGFFGWDFSEAVQTPIHGADPLTAREAEVAKQLAQVSALQARVERERALRPRPSLGLGRVARRSPEASPRAAFAPGAIAAGAPPGA